MQSAPCTMRWGRQGDRGDAVAPVHSCRHANGGGLAGPTPGGIESCRACFSVSTSRSDDRVGLWATVRLKREGTAHGVEAPALTPVFGQQQRRSAEARHRPARAERWPRNSLTRTQCASFAGPTMRKPDAARPHDGRKAMPFEAPRPAFKRAIKRQPARDRNGGRRLFSAAGGFSRKRREPSGFASRNKIVGLRRPPLRSGRKRCGPVPFAVR
jgi:hypothetical protein